MREQKKMGRQRGHNHNHHDKERTHHEAQSASKARGDFRGRRLPQVGHSGTEADGDAGKTHAEHDTAQLVNQDPSRVDAEHHVAE